MPCSVPTNEGNVPRFASVGSDRFSYVSYLEEMPMHRLRMSHHARADVVLVSYGDRRSWKDRKRFFALVDQALDDIRKNPRSGKRHHIAGMEVFTFHIRRWWRPAYHYFLYRV